MLSPKTFDNPREDAAKLRAARLKREGYDDPRADAEHLQQMRAGRDRPNPTFEKLKELWGALGERVEKLREGGPKSPEEQAQTAIISVEVLESQQEKSIGFFGALRKKVQAVDWSGIRKHFASSMGVLGATQPLRVGDRELQLKPEIPFWNGAKVKEALQNFAGSVREKFKSRGVRDAEAGYEEVLPEISTEDRLQELGRTVDLEALRSGLDEFYGRSSYAGGKERKALRRFADEYLAQMDAGDFAEIFGEGEINREAVRELAGEIMAEYGEERERRNQEQQAKWRGTEFNADFDKLSDIAVQRMVVEVYAKSLLESPRSGLPAEMVPVFLEGIKADLATKDPAEIEALMNPDASATPNKNAVLAYVQEYLTRPAPEGEVSLTPEQKSNLQKGLFLKLSSRLGQMDPRTREITKTLVTGLSTDELSQLFADLTDVNSLSSEALEGLVQEVQATTREVRERKAREDELLRQAEVQRQRETPELEQFISTDTALEAEVDPNEVEELSRFFSRTDTGTLTGNFEDGFENLDQLLTPLTEVNTLETDEQRQERWQRRAQEDEVFEERMREVEEFNRRQEVGDGLSFEEVTANLEAEEEAQFQDRLREAEEFNEWLEAQDQRTLEDVLAGLEESSENDPEQSLEEQRDAQFEATYARYADRIERELELTVGPALLSELAIDPKAELAHSLRYVDTEDLANDGVVEEFIEEDVRALAVEALVDKPYAVEGVQALQSSLERINTLLAQKNIHTTGLDSHLQKLNEILNPGADFGRLDKLEFKNLSAQELAARAANFLFKNELDRLSEKIINRVLEEADTGSSNSADTYRGVPFVRGQSALSAERGQPFVSGGATPDKYKGEAFVHGAYRVPQAQVEDAYQGTAFNVEEGPRTNPDIADTYQGTAFVLDREVSVDDSVELTANDPEFSVEPDEIESL